MTITSSSGLSDSEIERMVQESEQFAEQDKVKKQLIEDGNKSASFADEIDKNLAEFKEQLDVKERENVEKLVGELRELATAALRGDDVSLEALKEKYDSVSMNCRSQILAECMLMYTCPRSQTQQASLGLFRKVYEKRAAESNSSSDSDAGSASDASKEAEGEKKN